MTDKKRFYQYQSLKNKYDKNGNCKNNTLTNLAKNQLYFNNPNNFNDPFDCWVLVDNTGTREQWINFLCERYPGCDRKIVETKVNKFTKTEEGLVFPYNRLSNVQCPPICCFSE